MKIDSIIFNVLYYVYISLENRWYQGWYENYVLIFWIIDLNVSPNVKMFFFLVGDVNLTLV